MQKDCLIEGSLEVKLPTISADEKQRWEESEKRREEDQKRESLRRKKIQARKKVGKSRNTVFFPMICGSGGSKSRLAKGIHLADVKKLRVLHGFGLQEGARGRKNSILRSFQHRWPQHGPNIAPRANIGPT